jgi:hypothetical protein
MYAILKKYIGVMLGEKMYVMLGDLFAVKSFESCYIGSRA